MSKPKFWIDSGPNSEPTLFDYSWFNDCGKWRMGHGPFTKWKNLNRRMAKLKNWPFTSNLAIRLFWPFVGPDRHGWEAEQGRPSLGRSKARARFLTFTILDLRLIYFQHVDFHLLIHLNLVDQFLELQLKSVKLNQLIKSYAFQKDIRRFDPPIRGNSLGVIHVGNFIPFWDALNFTCLSMNCFLLYDSRNTLRDMIPIIFNFGINNSQFSFEFAKKDFQNWRSLDGALRQSN